MADGVGHLDFGPRPTFNLLHEEEDEEEDEEEKYYDDDHDDSAQHSTYSHRDDDEEYHDADDHVDDGLMRRDTLSCFGEIQLTKFEKYFTMV